MTLLKIKQKKYIHLFKPFLPWFMVVFVFVFFVLDLLLGDVKILSVNKLYNPIFRSIILDIRLPSILVGCFAAINFTLSGLILQVITQNKLATPNMIGMNTGASLFAVISLVCLSPAGLFSTNAFAFLGSFLSCLLYIFLSSNKSSKNLLNGIALDSIFISLTAILLLTFPNETGSISLWLAGSLWGKSYEDLKFLLPCSLFGIFFCFLFAQKLNLLSLTDTQAQSLGLAVRKNQLYLLLVSCVLSGSAVASVGPIGFLSLFIPNMSRLFYSENIKKLLPFSIISSLLIVIIADIISRTAIAPRDIPIGIVISIICSPYLIFLMYDK